MFDWETFFLTLLAFLTFSGKFSLTEIAFTQVIFPKRSSHHVPYWKEWTVPAFLTILVNVSLTYMVLIKHFELYTVLLVTFLDFILLSVSTLSQYLQVKKKAAHPYECGGNFYSRLITFFLYFVTLGVMIGQIVYQQGTPSTL